MRLIVKAAGAAAALPLILTACSTSASTGSAPSTQPTTTTTAAASPSATDPDAGLFTGTQLKSMLAPASFFPASFSHDPSGSVNSGDTFQAATPPGKLACGRLDTTGWVDLSDIGSVSFAQSDFIDKSISEEYAQEIDEYQGAGAKKVMAALRKVATRCRTFPDRQTSSTVTVKLGKGPSLGDDSLSFTLTSPRWQGGTTLEAIRIGTAVVTVLYSAVNGDGAAQAGVLAGMVAGKVIQKSLSGLLTGGDLASSQSSGTGEWRDHDGTAMSGNRQSRRARRHGNSTARGPGHYRPAAGHRGSSKPPTPIGPPITPEA